MKNLAILIISLSFVLISCDDTKEKQQQKTAVESKEKQEVIEKKDLPKPITKQVESEMINGFLQDVNTLKDIKNPIVDFIAEAEKTAKQKMSFNAENINEVLTTAKQYKNMVIVVGKHTIVKIIDLDKCIASGSWKACMPYGEGFIKRKSVLNYKEDYTNNIIGRSDAQERVAYFFNLKE